MTEGKLKQQEAKDSSMRNMLSIKHPRLGELYEIDEQIGFDLLGAEKRDYRRLMNLRYKVREEIRKILKAEKANREDWFKAVRSEMKRQGFTPSSANDEEVADDGE